MGGIREGRYVIPEFGKDGGGRPRLYPGDGLKEFVLVREPLAAKGFHLGLALILVLLRQRHFIAQLAYHVDIRIRYYAGKRTHDRIPAMLFDRSGIDRLEQFIR